jgi:cell division protein ZapE
MLHSMTISPFRRAYDRAKSQQGFVDDISQDLAVDALEQCFQTLDDSVSNNRRGVYLWGPVGRGKTWLMDLFHHNVRQPSRRQHFHHFMQWVHRRLFSLSGIADPLTRLAAELAAEIRVLCFDELFVTDIGDAMLLGGLFQAMLDTGIVIVATSNQPPEQLYCEGFNRVRFLPAIAALQRHMRVVAVDGGQDHRLHSGQRVQRYWVNNSGALTDVFARLTGTLPVIEDAFSINARPLPVVSYSEAAIWVRFSDLCGRPFSAADFIALCDRFPAILLSETPNLSARPQVQKIARGTEDGVEQVAAGDRQLPALSINDDTTRRFIALVDECYDRRIPLYIEATAPLLELYTDGHLMAPFRRTISRLQAMQYQRFGAT